MKDLPYEVATSPAANCSLEIGHELKELLAKYVNRFNVVIEGTIAFRSIEKDAVCAELNFICAPEDDKK